MEEEANEDNEGEICIVSGRKKLICTCPDCLRNWRLSKSKDLPSSQPCMKRPGDESCKPQFNSQTLSACKWNGSDEYEPFEKKSKLSDSKSKDQRKLLPTKFAAEKFDSGEVVTTSTTQGVSDLSKNKNQTTSCRGGAVIDISDELTISTNSDSDCTLPNLTPPMSDEENDRDETTLVNSSPGISGDDKSSEIIDITENNPDSEVLFNYSQEDAIILISDDDDDDDDEEVGDGEYDDDDDEEEEDVDRRRRGMDGESSKKPHHRNNIGFVNFNAEFTREESKFYQGIKKETPDSWADYGIDASTKHKIKKEVEEEEAEEHSRNSENSKVNSITFAMPSVKLEPNSSDEETGKAIQNPENTQLCLQVDIKQEKSDSQDSDILFEELEESTKPNPIVAKDKQDDPSGDKRMEPTIVPLKRKVCSKRFSSSTSDDDDDDTQCYPLKTSKVTKTVSQWLTKQGDHGKSLTKPPVSSVVAFDDDSDAGLSDDGDDDELYMCATQVEENLFKEGQLNKKGKKESPEISRRSKQSEKTPKPSTAPESPKYSSKTIEDLGESSSKTARDSLTPVLAKILFGNANTSTPHPLLVTEETKVKLRIPRWKNTEEDSDSDSSIYSVATQVDHNISLVNENDADNDSDDDDDGRLYMQNTQVDSVSRKANFKSKKSFYASSKRKKLLNRNDNDSDSDDSQFSVATQVDSNIVPKTGHQMKNSYLFPKVSTSVINSRQVPRTKESEFKTPKFPHRKKATKGIPPDAYFNKAVTPTSIQHSNTSYKDDEDSDSDSSVFSIATQIDNALPCQNDGRKDDPYFQATQVDKNAGTEFPSPKANSFKIPLLPTKKLCKPSTLKLDIRHCKERSEDYDSDDSSFSVATQVDDPWPLNINNEEQEEFYMKETQADEPFTSKSSKSQHYLKPKPPRKNSTSKPKADNDDDGLFLAATQVDSVNSSEAATQATGSSYNNFLLGLAATEPSGVGTVSSSVTPQQMEREEKEEQQSDPKFADFLLNLCEDTDRNKSACPKSLGKASEIEPQRLKSRKEIRENFKQQKMKMDNKSKLRSPEKSPTNLFYPTVLSIKDSAPPKKKRPSSKNSNVIKEGISSAKNQLEGRFFFKSLDKTPAKWTKSSSVAVGSSASLSSDVTLPNADEIKKLGLPLIETPKRRRPLPETLIKNHPEESQDIRRPSSPVIDTATPGSSTRNRPPPTPPTPPTPSTPPTPPTPPIPLGPTLTNNPKTNYSCNSSGSSKISHSKHGPPSSTPSLKPLPLFENSNKCFAKDFNSFHIPKIKNPSQKLNPDSTQATPTTSLPHKSSYSIPKQTFPPEVPKCAPSYPKSSLSHSYPNTNQSTSNTNPSKRVTFSNVNKVEVFQQPHWSRSNQQEAHTDLLKYLLRWNTKWLQEQDTLKTSPPIVSKDQLFPLLQSYPSYTEYVSVIQPLLLLEIWECVYREYMETMLKARILKVACNNIRKASPSHVDYIIYGIVPEMEQISNNCISEGDFIILKLRVKNSTSQSNSSSSSGNHGDSSEYPVFGFVDSVSFQKPHYYNGILDRFPDLASWAKTIRNFRIFRAIIKCHYRNLTHCFSQLLEVQFLTSLIPFLRQYKALTKFVSNPLHPHILNPADGTALVTDSAIPVNGNYNTSQKKAISAAAEMACLPISKPNYCLVQGPPGTGKSHTIIGMIQKIKEQKPQSKILLCAPSNGAVDELMRRLIENRQKAQAKSQVPLKFVRIGNPKHIHNDVIEYSMKKLILRNFKPNGVKQSCMLAEKNQYCNELKRNEEEICKMYEQPRSSLRDEKIRKLKKDSRYIKDKVDLLKKQLENNQAAMNSIEPTPAEEAAMEKSLLSKADVICGTLSTCGSGRILSKLADERFSCIIIDEASQCCELDSLIPLQYNCCKLILIGDTEQLSPTIISQLALEYNYGQSLFERLCKHYKYKDKNSVIMLNVQYRMHPDICKFPNRYIYNNQLISDSSLCNPVEANFTVSLCECLSNLQVGRPLLKIAVIAPYREQKKLLECLLAKRKLSNVDVTTVDGFQGRENDIIIMSCVRAHGSFGSIGFLKNRRRLNVALTRAKFALYIVGHLASLEGDEDWKSLIQDALDRHLVVRVGHPDHFQSVIKRCLKG
ncbi:Hypothetical predicted protein [Octopus vulgaris]|uniref:Helicase senataxin n=1 Tax=Octopus vulgaris TaxID=6645 RepID=A0AA36BWQ1_OCTVU|nr:Hypothetical predicted protein [Octopus vulgaris]